MDQTIPERVAVLESQQVTTDTKLDDITSRLQAIHDDLTKYKGMAGLLAFLVSALVTAASLFGDWIKAHWK